MLSRNAAQCADFLEGGEEGIVPVPAGLLLRQTQKSLVNIQDCLHEMRLGHAGATVNVELRLEKDGVEPHCSTKSASMLARNCSGVSAKSGCDRNRRNPAPVEAAAGAGASPFGSRSVKP